MKIEEETQIMELYGRSTGSNGSQSDHQSEWVPVEQESGLDGGFCFF